MCIRDRPVATSFSMTAALVAGVPNPFLSASSGISSLPAVSIADRSVSSVNCLGGVVLPSLTAQEETGSDCPSESSGRVLSCLPSVSYTHLDVYKRQSLNCATEHHTSPRAQRRGYCGRAGSYPAAPPPALRPHRRTQRNRPPETARGRPGGLPLRRCSCLLYTSRCV